MTQYQGLHFVLQLWKVRFSSTLKDAHIALKNWSFLKCNREVEVNGTEFLSVVHKTCYLEVQVVSNNHSHSPADGRQSSCLPGAYDTVCGLATFTGRQRSYQTFMSLGKSSELLENVKTQSNQSQSQYFISITLWHC